MCTMYPIHGKNYESSIINDERTHQCGGITYYYYKFFDSMNQKQEGKTNR